MATYSTEKLDTPAEVEPPKIADETEATRSESTLPSDATQAYIREIPTEVVAKEAEDPAQIQAFIDDAAATIFEETSKDAYVNYNDEASVSDFNSNAINSFLASDVDIKNTISDVFESNKGAIDAEINRLITKHDLNAESSELDINKANEEFSSFQNNLLFAEGSAIKKRISQFQNGLNKAHNEGVRKFISDKAYAESGFTSVVGIGMGGLPISIPKNIYGSLRSLYTDIKKAGLMNDEARKLILDIDFVERKAKEEEWEDSKKVGLVRGEVHNKPWKEVVGELKGRLSSARENQYKTFLNISDREAIDNAFDQASLSGILEGQGNILDLVLEQLGPMAAGAITLGSSWMASSAGDTYLELLKEEAMAKFNTEDPTIEEMQSIAESNANLAILDKAMIVGFGNAGLETVGFFGITKASQIAMKGGKSILRDGTRKSFSEAVRRSGKSIKYSAANEGITEALQTGLSDAVTNQFSGVNAYIESAATGALVGGLLPLGGKIAKQSATEIKASYNIISGKFNSKSTEAFFNSKIEDIKTAVEKKEISDVEGQEKIEHLTEIRNANTRIPKYIKGESRDSAVDLMIERLGLERKIEGLDKSMTGDEQARIKEINLMLSSLDRTSKTAKAVAKIGKGLKMEIISEDSQAEDMGATKLDADGTGWASLDGKTIYINKTKSARFGSVNVAAHELLHQVLHKTLFGKNEDGTLVGKNVVRGLAESLKQELVNIAPSKTFDSGNFNARLAKYKKDPTSVKAEETLTLFADALAEGHIKYNEGVMVKLGDIVRRVLQDLGFANIKFDNGRDVYNFLKDYNTSIQKGRLTRAQKSVAREGVDVGSGIRRFQGPENIGIKVKQSKTTTSEEVQEAWERSGKDSGWEVSEMYRGMAIAKAAKYRDLPLYQANQDILVDEILTGKRGVYDMVQAYDPSKNDSLSAYINTFLPRRVIEAVNRVLGTEFTEDVTERKDIVAAPPAEMLIIDDAPKVASKIRRRIDLTDQQMNLVRKAAIRALVTAPKIKADIKGKPFAFKDHLLKTYNTLLFKDIKNHMGTGSDYKMFVKKSYELFRDLVPLKQKIAGRMEFFYEADIDPASGKQKRMSTDEANMAGIPMDKAAAGPLKWLAKEGSLKEFQAWALTTGSLKGARKTTMARILAQEIGLDATMEVLQNPAQLDYDENGNEIEGSKVNVMERVGLSNRADMAEASVAGMVSIATDRHQNLRFNKAIISGAKVLNVNTGNVTMDRHIKGLIKHAEVHGEDDDYRLLFEEAKRSFQRITKDADIKRLKADIAKAGGIDGWLDAQIKLGGEITNPHRVFNSPTAKSKEDIDLVMAQTWEALNDGFKKNPRAAALAYINIFQLAVSQRGTESVKEYRTNAKFHENHLKGWAKENKIALTLVATDKGNTLYLDGKKATEGDVLEMSNPVYSKAAEGNLDKKTLDEQHARAAELQNELIDTLDILRKAYKNGNLSDLAASTVISFLGNHTRGIGRRLYPLTGRAILAGDTSVKNNTVEHNPPWFQTSGVIALYVKGAMDKNVLKSEFQNLSLNIVNTKLAKKVNEKYGQHDPFHGGLNEDGSPKRYNDTGIAYVWSDTQELVEEGIRQSKALEADIGNMIELKRNIPMGKEVSKSEATMKGRLAARKAKNMSIIPSSAEDFEGLMYKILAPGKEGEAQQAWFTKHLYEPFNVGMNRVSKSRVRMLNSYRALKKASKDIKPILKNIAFDHFTGENVVRIYIWNLRGEAEGTLISEKEIDQSIAFVESNPSLKDFALDVANVAGPLGFGKPNEFWALGNITTDLTRGLDGNIRDKALEEWKTNKEAIFTPNNINKLEAAFGKSYRLAVEDSLRRMQSGRNRQSSGPKQMQEFTAWINNAVGATMFLNARSAVLQTISTINYLNWTDNNPIAASTAFANMPQYIQDFNQLWSSDFLLDRRMGMRIDINEADIINSGHNSRTALGSILNRILKKGFILTQLGDSFAIAAGGATFYRNRINTYLKSGMLQEEAETKAFEDFRSVTEVSQQSSRPDRISEQQASSMGRIILAYANTPSQYARIIKKSSLDLVNGRGDAKTNVSKILYYSFIQNVIFNTLQGGLFYVFLDDDDDNTVPVAKQRRAIEGMISSLLRGTGFYGAAVDTAWKMVNKYLSESEKSRPDYGKVAYVALDISPPVSSKIKKLKGAFNAKTYGSDDFGMGGIDDPAVDFLTKGVEAITNLPAARAVTKIRNVIDVVENEQPPWIKLAIGLGWQEWQLGGDSDKKQDLINKSFKFYQKTGNYVDFESMTKSERERKYPKIFKPKK